MHYSRFLIKDNDQFLPYDFPQIEEDVDMLAVTMAKMPTPENTEMLLSYVRDHSMQSEWVNANPVLAEMICTHSLPVKNLEALFASCRKNLLFRIQLEEYITQKLKPSLSCESNPLGEGK